MLVLAANVNPIERDSSCIVVICLHAISFVVIGSSYFFASLHDTLALALCSRVPPVVIRDRALNLEKCNQNDRFFPLFSVSALFFSFFFF